MIDIDGTISELRKSGQEYTDVRVNKNAIEKIKALKAAGHYIILQTARHMKTCNGDQGKVVARIGKQTLDWLARYEIPYDEIYFGKPYADVYLDDLAETFTAWDSINTHDFDTDTVNVVIPMAGLGSRFVKAGYTDPKPLIDVLGEPMIAWAMKSFDFLPKVKKFQLIFIILKEHEDTYGMSEKLKELFGNAIIVTVIDHLTRGQAETVLAAKSLINNHNKLFIYNCDNYSTAPIWELIEAEDPDGILPCFKATDPRYSYARLDEYGYVTETAEKRVISDWASNGMYYFKRGKDFVSAAEVICAHNMIESGELYVAPCYNQLLLSGKKIKIVEITQNHVLGTPEELDKFLKHYPKKD